jgi:hypothetical protein
MLEYIRNKLEENNVVVLTKPFDFHFKTRTFIQLLDGRTLAYYDYLHEIPNTIYDGEELSIGEQAIPAGETIYTNENLDNACNGVIWDGDNMSMGSSLVLPAAALALIYFLVKLIAVFIVVYLIISKMLAPCPLYTETDGCIKTIQYPNCSAVTINSCHKDAEGNPDPEVIARADAPIEDWMEIVKWVAIAALAVGGIYIAAKIIPSLIPSKKQSQYYSYPPPQQYYPPQNYTYSYS